MDLFEAYFQEFNLLIVPLEQNFTQEQTLSQIHEIEEKVSEIQDNLKQMEIEVAGLRGEKKQTAMMKFINCRDRYREMKRKISDQKFSLENKELIGTKSYEDRLRMKTCHRKLEESSDIIRDCIVKVADMEQTAVEIQSELANNREKIIGAREKTAEFISIMDPARRLIRTMDRRRWTLGLF